MPNSDLGRDNQNRVAASAAEIKIVLLKDPGLMVELKRWVAKDATDHGQIVGDEDLTNEAIFDRLNSDVQFRSVATLLVQRYGYLVPKLNPDSDAGKEHELLIQERVKWAVQHAEEGRAKAHAETEQAIEKARACAERDEQGCPELRTGARLSPRTDYEDQDGEMDLPLRNGPIPPSAPPSAPDGGNPPERAQLMQTAEEYGNDVPQLPFGSPEAGSPITGLMLPNDSRNFVQQAGTNGMAGMNFGADNPAIRGNAELQNALLNISGNDFGGDQLIENQTYSSPLFNGLTGSAGRSFSEQPRRKEVPQPTMVRQPNPYNDIPSLYEMYVQAVPRPATPRRFGIDVFENRRRNPRIIPMDLSAVTDYVVGPSDGLTIDLWGSVSRRFMRTVDREGRVSLPEVGPVFVSGRSLADVQQNLQQ